MHQSKVSRNFKCQHFINNYSTGWGPVDLLSTYHWCVSFDLAVPLQLPRIDNVLIFHWCRWIIDVWYLWQLPQPVQVQSWWKVDLTLMKMNHWCLVFVTVTTTITSSELMKGWSYIDVDESLMFGICNSYDNRYKFRVGERLILRWLNIGWESYNHWWHPFCFLFPSDYPWPWQAWSLPMAGSMSISSAWAKMKQPQRSL